MIAFQTDGAAMATSIVRMNQTNTDAQQHQLHALVRVISGATMAIVFMVCGNVTEIQTALEAKTNTIAVSKTFFHI